MPPADLGSWTASSANSSGWGDARDFLADRFRGTDQRIYRIETAEW
jgi:hypothetical protein